MLLVVAVIGTMIVYGANRQHQRNREQATTKTAHDIQNILISAAAYYILEGKQEWPENMQTLITNGYLLDTMECSPILTSTSTDCANRASYTISLPKNPDNTPNLAAPLFTLKLTVPSDEIAKDIASKLPSTYVSTNVVYASTPVPGKAHPSPDQLLVKIAKNQYYESDSDTDYQPVNPNGQEISCPPGWSKNFRAALSYVTNCKSTFGEACSSASLGTGSAAREFYINIPPLQMSRDNPPPQDVTWMNSATAADWQNSITVNTDFRSGGDLHAGNAMVIEYCIPPGYGPGTSAF